MVSKNERLRERYLEVKRGRHWTTWPLLRSLRAAQFRRMAPFGKGKSGGLSIIRYYWADFLEQHAGDIKGRALEVEEIVILRDYGGPAVTQAEAIDLTAHHGEVKVVADLARADHVPSDSYDCFVLPFSTAVIYDIEAALYHAVRILKPGGVLLTNFWCMDYYFHHGLNMHTGGTLYMAHWPTPLQAHNWLHALGLNERDYVLQTYGNLMARMAFLLNLPAKEMTVEERDTVDEGQPLSLCLRVVKPARWQPAKPIYHDLLWSPNAKPQVMSAQTRQYGDQYTHRKTAT
jgi:hypothetical protein